MSDTVHPGASARGRAIRLLQRVFPPLLTLLRVVRLVAARDSYLRSTGLLHSYRRGLPESPAGEPLPWMNYGAIRLLEERLGDDLVLFEYGSGYSTRFFAARVRRIVSVEYDRSWFETLRPKLPPNAELLHRDLDYDGDYCRTIDNVEGEFDLVIVDGRDRVRCALNAVAKLSPRGAILFDDSDREAYADGLGQLAAQGFRRLDLEGIRPTGHARHRCSFFYRDGNCLGL